jgi:RNA polymerase sigma factor (sigma-70 family)
MSQKISNEEYETAYYNRKNIAIMRKAAYRFKKSIPRDELHTIKLEALWKTLQYFDITKGRSFTSYLYKRVDYLCRDWIYKKKNSKKKGGVYKDFYIENFDIDFEDILGQLPDDLCNIIKLRYINNLSIKKISIITKFCPATVRTKIDSGIKKLRIFYQDTI